MMRVARSFLFVVGVGLWAGAVGAQSNQTIYVPQGKSLDKKFGGWLMPAPFESGPSRMQQVIRGNEIAKVSASISSFALRGENVFKPVAGVTVQKLLVELGYARTTPQQMSTNYNANRGVMTTVLNGKYSLPNLQPNTPASTFQLRFPLSTPFAYSVSKGNLLLDMSNNDKYSYGGWSYELDCAPTGDRKQVFSVCGELPSNGACPVYTVRGNVVLGKSVELDVVNMDKPYPVATIIGASRFVWNGTRLPLNMTQFGASKKSMLYTSVDLILPMTGYLNQGFPYNNTYGAKTKVSVPNQPALVGANIMTQAFAWHGTGGGSLPITLTAPWTIWIGDKEPSMQLLFSPWTTGNGFYFGGSRGGGPAPMYGGAVLRFDGKFQ